MKHFTLEELTRSQTAHRLGLSNAPSEAHRRNLEEMVGSLLDPLREAWVYPAIGGTATIYINQ